MLNRVEERVKKLAALASVMAMAAAEALAQDHTDGSARRILVSIPDRKLAVIENGHVIRTFEVAVGAAKTPSPTGAFKVVNRVENPTWYYKGKVVGPGTGNPVGTRWIGLSEHGYGLHGTNAPKSIGKSASHGCIRLRNADVEQLFALVAVGDQVEIVAERTAEIAGIFGGTPAITVVAHATTPAAPATATVSDSQ